MVRKKPNIDSRTLIEEIRSVLEKYDNVMITSIYEDLYHIKSDVKILFVVDTETNKGGNNPYSG